MKLRWLVSAAMAAATGQVTGQAAAADEVNGEFEANHCELHVDSFGVGSYRYLDTTERFIDVMLRVNERELAQLQGDEILAAGASVSVRTLTAHVDGAGRPFLDVTDFVEKVSAQRVAPGSWQLRFAFEHRAAPQTHFKEVRGIAFFVELKRQGTGRVERLWLRTHGHDFTLDGIFGDKPGTTRSIGIGTVRYPEASSPVYYQKQACGG